MYIIDIENGASEKKKIKNKKINQSKYWVTTANIEEVREKVI